MARKSTRTVRATETTVTTETVSAEPPVDAAITTEPAPSIEALLEEPDVAAAIVELPAEPAAPDATADVTPAPAGWGTAGEMDAVAFDAPLAVLDEMMAPVGGAEAPAEPAPADFSGSEPEPAAEPTNLTFDERREAVPEEEVEVLVRQLALAIDDRAAFEEAKNPDNANIQRTLAKTRREVVTKRAARVVAAAGVNIGFINRTLHDGSRYNVYAIGKFSNLVDFVTIGSALNAINRACLGSLLRCVDAGIDFTLDLAKCAASDKIPVKDAGVRRHLVRHTVSASTAPTQASSTMQALVTLGVVRTEGSSKNPTYKLTDSPLVAKLRELILPA